MDMRASGWFILKELSHFTTTSKVLYSCFVVCRISSYVTSASLSSFESIIQRCATRKKKKKNSCYLNDSQTNLQVKLQIYRESPLLLEESSDIFRRLPTFKFHSRLIRISSESFFLLPAPPSPVVSRRATAWHDHPIVSDITKASDSNY